MQQRHCVSVCVHRANSATLCQTMWMILLQILPRRRKRKVWILFSPLFLTLSLPLPLSLNIEGIINRLLQSLYSLCHPADDTPETCIYSNWSPWSACSSATCEKGKRMRQRMLKAQLDLSVPCPHTQDFEPCMGPGCSDEGECPFKD